MKGPVAFVFTTAMPYGLTSGAPKAATKLEAAGGIAKADETVGLRTAGAEFWALAVAEPARTARETPPSAHARRRAARRRCARAWFARTAFQEKCAGTCSGEWRGAMETGG